MREPSTFEVDEYAQISAELSDPACDREAVLSAHGLSEGGWADLDQRFQDRLSRAMDTDGEGVPPLLAAYAEAFARARAALAAGHEVLSLDRFADATREIQRRGDPQAALARLGIPLVDFIRANEHWTRRMLADPALVHRFRARLG